MWDCFQGFQEVESLFRDVKYVSVLLMTAHSLHVMSLFGLVITERERERESV